MNYAAKAGSITSTANPATLEALAKKTEIDEADIDDTIANWDVKAAGQRLFVARLRHETSAGGIFIPQEYQDQQCDAVVISAGPMAIINDRHPANEEEAKKRLSMSADDLECATRRFLKPGDRVTFGKWSGETQDRKRTVKRGLNCLMIMNDTDIIGVPEKKE